MEPLRVVELGGGVAAAYCARLLGDHGADVIKIEHRKHPDTLDSGYRAALNLNKRSVFSDSVELDALLAWADVLVHDQPLTEARTQRIDAESLREDRPGLVTMCITPFGHSGPYAGYSAEELTVANAGGWANLCPSTHTDPNLPPLKVTGDQCALMTALAGATVALAVSREARRSGVGEFVDLAQQAYVASVLEVGVPAFSYRGEVAARHHQRSLIPWRIFEAADGPVFIVCVEQDQWERLVAFMGNPEWARLEVFADQPSRAENQDLVHNFVQDFVAGWRAEELYHAAQQHRICVAPVMGLEQFARNEHLHARQLFRRATPDDRLRAHLPEAVYLAPAVLTSSGRAPTMRPAPEPGEHSLATSDLPSKVLAPATSAASAPLAGVRVIDLTWAWAGPFCTMNLAHLGAEVIRIESEKRADLYRRLPVHVPDTEADLDSSGMFNQWNQGKSSMAIDIARAEGRALVEQLVRRADVVVQNFATGVMERLGLGYERLREINPGIILASISGYGQSGPYREYMGYGPAIPPLTGLAMSTGYVDGGVEELGLSMPDPTAGITAAMGIVSALCRRDATGSGDHLDVSLWEATAVLNIENWMRYQSTGVDAPRIGNRHRAMAPHGCFRCAGEDHWITIACADDTQWSALADCIAEGLAADVRFHTLAGRQSHEAELEGLISAWTETQDRWQLTSLLQGLGIAAFPTLSTADIVTDKHLNARGFIERLTHPVVGARAHTGIPWRFNLRDNGVRSPAPCLGADTRTHLRGLLGLADDEIDAFYDDGILGI